MRQARVAGGRRTQVPVPYPKMMYEAFEGWGEEDRFMKLAIDGDL